ncbi:unnamed protein product [Paramecium octaurelia]|uniref:Uncharacterized protein n=1 Tax=Paramecium octaurelia TaxID=43137 RepID=A0A8S1TBL1_PAROT|nr:unnamed protein product [Paramecium octaurelia]
MNFEDYQYLLKIVLIGGKGSIIKHSQVLASPVSCLNMSKAYSFQEYDFTIELELERKSIEFDDGIAVQNQLWDTLTIIILISQEVLNLSQCRKTFCQNAAPDIIFYSINSQSSFNSLLKLFEILAKVQSDQFQTVIVATQEEDQKSYLFLKRLPIQQEPNFLKSPIMTKIKLMQFLILYLTMSCNQYIPIKSIHQKLNMGSK